MKAPVLMAAVMMVGHAVGETGRWAGHWMMESRVVETEVESDEGDAPQVERGVPELDVTPVFAEPPQGFLVDAGELLSPGARVERAEFLRHHADDSKISLYVYLFGQGAEIPVETGVERFFVENNAAVVYYFIGEPQRAGFYLSPSLVGVVSDAEQRRSLQSSIMQAAGKIDPEDQLDAFLVQMSIRLYWMERMMDGSVSGTDVLEEIEKAIVSEPRNILSEMPLPDHWLLWLAGVFFLVVVLPLVWWVRRLRAKYRFPEFEVEPRLGGRHAAGVGAVISYLSPNVPPAAQVEQVPDFPHRR